ncbi:MAG: stage II sporulation protein R [Clostridia bacterium]|nr:stage II sporulation protein R [Clostridia bacterium]
MKYLPIFLFLLLCVGIFAFRTGDEEVRHNYLRVHIRANSNLECDQNIKYVIKDEVVDFITPYLVGCDSKEKSVAMMTGLLDDIESVCDGVLKQNNFQYKSSASIREEYFPTRVYDNITLAEGIYDALIIELGSGEGDNWWCIVYPPLCFVNKTNTSVQNIQYQSYLMKIVKKYFD